MLKPVTNWNELRDALEAIRARIHVCQECNHVWIRYKRLRALKPPRRCPNCRVGANSEKHDHRGRPTLESPTAE